MQFKINRGTHEIGGSCVEIWTESTRIVVDFGMPLVNPDGTQFDSKAINSLTKDELIKIGVLPEAGPPSSKYNLQEMPTASFSK